MKKIIILLIIPFISHAQVTLTRCEFYYNQNNGQKIYHIGTKIDSTFVDKNGFTEIKVLKYVTNIDGVFTKYNPSKVIFISKLGNNIPLEEENVVDYIIRKHLHKESKDK